MKKPRKPKPKRRAPAGKAREALPKAFAPAPVRTVAATVPIATASARVRVAMPAPTGEDRAAFALLLVPFLIVAVSLGMARSRSIPMPALPDIAVRPAIERVTLAPPPPLALPVPDSRTAGPAETRQPPAGGDPLALLPAPLLVYPPPVPVIEPRVAMAPPAPVLPQALPRADSAPVVGPIAVAPAPIVMAPPRAPPDASFEAAPPVVPSVVIAFPPPLPELSLASLDVRPAAPPVAAPAAPEVPVTSAPGPRPQEPLPRVPGDISYPPPLPDLTVASLDLRGREEPAAAPQACLPSSVQLASFAAVGRLARAPRQPRLTGVDGETFGRRLAAAALAQTKDLVIYSARYQPMAYPMGDVMALHGACIDVVIRAYRALGIDLQEEVQRARPSRGDTNIDHRRTENMRRFLERSGASLPITSFPEDYKPGDIVTYHRPFSRVSTSHIAVVTDVLAPTGRPMIVHNRGYGPQLEDALFVDRITGHYRYVGPPVAAEAPAPVRSQAQSGASARATTTVR